MSADYAGRDADLEARLRSAVDELAASGASYVDVARTLKKAGCRGYKGKCHTCPVAHWIALKLGIKISDREIRVARGVVYVDKARRKAQVTLPDQIKSFIRCFDRDDFPSLEATR